MGESENNKDIVVRYKNQILEKLDLSIYENPTKEKIIKYF